MTGPRNSVWTSSFMRINEEGKLVGRHLDFFGSTDLLRSSMGMHVPNASSLEDIRISDAPETEVGVDFCLTWNIDPRWVFIGYEKNHQKIHIWNLIGNKLVKHCQRHYGPRC